MKRSPSVTEPHRAGVFKLVETLIGERPLRLRRMPLCGVNATFEATLSKISLMVRTNPDGAVFASTARNLAALRAIGLPVPTVLASGATPEFAYVLLERLPGTDLRHQLKEMSRDQRFALAERVIDAENAAARLPSLGGFGYAGVFERGPHRSWRAVLDASLRRSMAASTQVEPLAERLTARLDREAGYLNQVAPTCFLDDLTTKNVIVDGGRLSGFVDFDSVCYGDRLLQLGLTHCAIAVDLGPSCFDYSVELCRRSGLTAAERGMVEVYAALAAIEFLARAPSRRAEERLIRLVAAVA